MQSTDQYELSEKVVRLAAQAGTTIGCAESCTGGLVCAALTDVSGSSAVVRGSIVSYAVPVKEDVLEVSCAITRNPDIGVVSAECAQEMAEGACRVLACDVAVSVTGIAGPGGAEPGKPVGTVWFAIATSQGSRAYLKHFAGNRSEVRQQAVVYALELLIAALEAHPAVDMPA